MKQPKKNRLRAAKIAFLVREKYEEEDPECSVIDILTDLRHYCDREGLDMGHLDRIARGHYLVECEVKVIPGDST
jgi:hypothetical protein